MAQFAGIETFPQPISVVYAKLADAGFVASSLSGATVISTSPDKAEWRVRPKLSFLSGSLDTTGTVTSRSPESSIGYELVTKGIGATSTVQATMTFSPTSDGGTTVTWTGDITSRTGLLKLVPSSLIEGSAKKVIADVWVDVHKAMGTA